MHAGPLAGCWHSDNSTVSDKKSSESSIFMEWSKQQYRSEENIASNECANGFLFRVTL